MAEEKDITAAAVQEQKAVGPETVKPTLITDSATVPVASTGAPREAHRDPETDPPSTATALSPLGPNDQSKGIASLAEDTTSLRSGANVAELAAAKTVADPIAAEDTGALTVASIPAETAGNTAGRNNDAGKGSQLHTESVLDVRHDRGGSIDTLAGEVTARAGADERSCQEAGSAMVPEQESEHDAEPSTADQSTETKPTNVTEQNKVSGERSLQTSEGVANEPREQSETQLEHVVRDDTVPQGRQRYSTSESAFLEVPEQRHEDVATKHAAMDLKSEISGLPSIAVGPPGVSNSDPDTTESVRDSVALGRGVAEAKAANMQGEDALADPGAESSCKAPVAICVEATTRSPWRYPMSLTSDQGQGLEGIVAQSEMAVESGRAVPETAAITASDRNPSPTNAALAATEPKPVAVCEGSSISDVPKAVLEPGRRDMEVSSALQVRQQMEAGKCEADVIASDRHISRDYGNKSDGKSSEIQVSHTRRLLAGTTIAKFDPGSMGDDALESTSSRALAGSTLVGAARVGVPGAVAESVPSTAQTGLKVTVQQGAGISGLQAAASPPTVATGTSARSAYAAVGKNVEASSKLEDLRREARKLGECEYVRGPGAKRPRPDGVATECGGRDPSVMKKDKKSQSAYVSRFAAKEYEKLLEQAVRSADALLSAERARNAAMRQDSADMREQVAALEAFVGVGLAEMRLRATLPRVEDADASAGGVAGASPKEDAEEEAEEAGPLKVQRHDGDTVMTETPPGAVMSQSGEGKKKKKHKPVGEQDRGSSSSTRAHDRGDQMEANAEAVAGESMGRAEGMSSVCGD
jgi:hypothetical protein